MRIPRFYLPHPIQAGQQLDLPPTLFHHAIQVLRLSAGESLILFNGDSGEYLARLETVGKRSATVLLENFSSANTESPVQLTLALAIIKPEKMDFALQKAVELGVTHIQPLITQRSVVRIGKEKADKKVEHWEGIAIAACEQSGRTRLPTISPPQTLDAWLEQKTTGSCLLLAPGEFPSIHQLPAQLPPPIALLIGPEGGFTDEEVEQCLRAGMTAVSLGPRILRAETASIAALTLLQHRYGDF